MKARFVYEELDFERGIDPKESMGIGSEEVRAIKKIGRHAEARGFKEAEIGPQHEEEGIINIKRWLYHSEMTDDDIEVILYKEEGFPYELMVYVATPQGDYQDSAEDWFDEITWDENLWEANDMNEQIRFNFDEPPYKRYVSRRGESGPQVPNPRKAGYGGLTDEEEEIVERHQLKIQELEDEVYTMEGEIEDLERELDDLTETPDDMELEQFYADVQVKYGERALDIMNSGIPKAEKIKEIDKLSPAMDFGPDEFEDLADQYEYYHPEEPDPEKVDEIKSKISKIERQKQERENTIEKLRTKIYNIETY